MHFGLSVIRYLTEEQFRTKTDYFLDSAFGTPAKEKLTLIEVGNSNSYNKVHFSKAIYLATNNDLSGIAELIPEKGRQIVLYSTNIERLSLERVASDLIKHGYFNIFIYEPGKEEWLKNQFPSETTFVQADGLDQRISDLSSDSQKAA